MGLNKEQMKVYMRERRKCKPAVETVVNQPVNPACKPEDVNPDVNLPEYWHGKPAAVEFKSVEPVPTFDPAEVPVYASEDPLTVTESEAEEPLATKDRYSEWVRAKKQFGKLTAENWPPLRTKQDGWPLEPNGIHHVCKHSRRYCEDCGTTVQKANPSPEQWTKAFNTIQQGKSRKEVANG